MTDNSKTIPPAIIPFIATALAYAMVCAWNAGITFQYGLPWNSIPVELDSLFLVSLPILATLVYLHNLDSLIFMRIAHLHHSLKLRLVITARSIFF